MPVYTLYTLESSNITVSGGAILSGLSQGDGSHLVGETITLNSNAWKTVTINDNDAGFEDNDGNQTLNVAQTYDGVSHASGRRVEAEYQITLEDPDGNTYTVIGFNIVEAGGGSPFGTIEGLAFIGPVGGFPSTGVPLTVLSSSEGPGGTTTPYSSYATPPCFTHGTRIETAHGRLPVEMIVPGMQVRTMDHGVQTVRWVGQTTIDWRDLAAQSRLRPVFIAKDALGPGQPERDMWVSPQHRLLQGGMRAALWFGSGEVLVVATHLRNDATIFQDSRAQIVTYFHLAFDRHELVKSDGLWSESFLPGQMAMTGMASEAQTALERVFPGAMQGTTGLQTARPCLKRREAQMLRAA